MNFSIYSVISIRIIASSSPNIASARALANSVLPTPVGPRKTKEPIGRFGSFNPALARRTAAGQAEGEEEDDEAESCVLAHASSGARLVCGEREAHRRARALPHAHGAAPDMALGHPRRGVARCVREPLIQVRQALPVLARIDARLVEPCARAARRRLRERARRPRRRHRVACPSMRSRRHRPAGHGQGRLREGAELHRAARHLESRSARSAPPPAFCICPADTDVAVFGKGSDPKLFDRPRELLGNVCARGDRGRGMPEPERKAVRELVVDRMLALFTGPARLRQGLRRRRAREGDRRPQGREAGRPRRAATRPTASSPSRSSAGISSRSSEPITKVGPDPQGLGGALESARVREVGEAAVLREDARADAHRCRRRRA